MFFTRFVRLLGSLEKRSGRSYHARRNRARLACEPLEGRAMMATLLATPVDSGEVGAHTPSDVPTGIVTFNLESNTHSAVGRNGTPPGRMFLGTDNGIYRSAVGGHVKVFDGTSPLGGVGLDVLIANTGGDRMNDNGHGTHVAGNIGAVPNGGANFLFGDGSVRLVSDGVSSDPEAGFESRADDIDTARKQLPVLMVLSDNRDFY